MNLTISSTLELQHHAFKSSSTCKLHGHIADLSSVGNEAYVALPLTGDLWASDERSCADLLAIVIGMIPEYLLAASHRTVIIVTSRIDSATLRCSSLNSLYGPHTSRLHWHASPFIPSAHVADFGRRKIRNTVQISMLVSHEAESLIVLSL